MIRSIPHSAYLSRTTGQLVTDCRGNVMVIFALVAPVVLGISGMAIDYARAYSFQTQLRMAADSTALTATQSVGNGASINDATAAAKAYWKSNLTGVNGIIPDPTITVTNSGGVAKTTVDYSGSVKTTLGGLLGMASVPVSGSASSQATVTAKTYASFSGSGAVYGDPHLRGADHYNAFFMCPNPYWYNMLSDSNIQVNIKCHSINTGVYGGTDVISDVVITLGTHKISVSNTFPSDDLESTADKLWHGQTTIDGVVYNPGQGYSNLANWPVGSVDAHIDDGGDINQYPNDHLTINTKQYQIAIFFEPGGDISFNAKAAGTCGVVPGGLWGETLGGIDDKKIDISNGWTIDVSEFAVTSSDWTGPQFNTTPCPTSVATKLRLTH